MLSAVGLIAAAVTSVTPVYLPLELLRPAGEAWDVRARQTVELVERVIQPRTGAVPRSFAQLGTPAEKVQLCRAQARLECWVAAASTAVQVSRDAEIASHFVLVRLLPSGGPEQVRILIWLVDRQAATALSAIASDQREAWLLSRATVRRRLNVTWGDGALERAFERLWDERSSLMRRRGEWRPNGRLQLKSDWLPPFQIRIDDSFVATATASQLTLQQIEAGERRIELTAVDRRAARTVTIGMDQTTVLHIDASEAAGLSDDDDRPALLWSGLGVAAAGASVLIAGLVMPTETQLVQLCSDGANCSESPRFARSSDYFTARQSADDGRGPLVVPLGYSMLITGTAWALTAALTDEKRVPWWAVVIGGVLGGAAYGISEAAQ